LKWKGENVLVSLNLLNSNIYASKQTAGNHDLTLVNPARGADDVIINGVIFRGPGLVECLEFR
jgi:hypothetical protein